MGKGPLKEWMRTALWLLPGRVEVIEVWEPNLCATMVVRVKAIFWRKRFCVVKDIILKPGEANVP